MAIVAEVAAAADAPMITLESLIDEVIPVDGNSGFDDAAEWQRNGKDTTDSQGKTDSQDQSAAADQSLDSVTTLPTELVVIDARVADVNTLLGDLLNRADRNFQIVRIGLREDGVAAISDALRELGSVSAIHLVVHGRDGLIRLGSETLSAGTLADYSAELSSWGSFLKTDADLLIYGCDVAQSEFGRAFISGLQALTGADVAASNNTTGGTSQGGDWVLEYAAGAIQTQVLFTSDAVGAWQHQLPAGQTITVTTTDDVVDAPSLLSVLALLLGNGPDGKVSLREAIIAANQNPDIDTIILGPGAYNISLTGNDDTAANGDFDIRYGVEIQGAGASQTIISGNGLDRVFDVRGGGTLTLTNATITGGFTDNEGGGVRVNSTGTLNLTNVIVSGNFAKSEGGGIYNDGTSSLTDVTIASNTAQNKDGGGIYNLASLQMTRVTLNANTAKKGGGAFSKSGATGFFATNVTISGNTSSQEGGGLSLESAATLRNVTIASNTAATAGAGIYANSANISLQNVILDANRLTNNAAANLSGAIVSQGYNISSDNTGSGLNQPSDKTSTDPKLMALGNYGGFTLTHALLATSPAVDGGTAIGAPSTDQRGVARNGQVDVGAFEYERVYVPTGEMRVNTTTTDVQETSASGRGSQTAIARDHFGNSVVTWSSQNQDGSGWGVYARRYDARGLALGGEIQVHQTTSDDQLWASVASDAAGNFVVTWTSLNQASVASGIYGRRFSASGSALTGEMMVNSNLTGTHASPVIAMNSAGQFVIAWKHEGSANGIYFRRFMADFTPQDMTDRQANPTEAGGEDGYSVAIDATGNFVIVWENADRIHAQWISAGGVFSASGSFIVDDGTFRTGQPSIAMNASGSYVVTYRNVDSPTQFATRGFNASGVMQFSDVTNRAGNVRSPSVQMNDDGSHLVTWQEDSGVNGDDIYVQKRAANGLANDAPILVNQQLAGHQNQASSTMLDINNFVTVWSGAGIGDTAGVFLRQFGTATIPVLAGNADFVTTPASTPLSIDVLANDSPSPLGSPILLDVQSPLHGAASITSGRKVSYTPTTGYVGNDTFDYLIIDGSEGTTHYWSLAGNAVDSVGTSHGTVSGATAIAGSYGTGLLFDESNNDVRIPDFSYSNEFTVSFDFRIDENSGTAFQYLYSHGAVQTAHSLNVFIGETGAASGYANQLATSFRDSNDTDSPTALNFSIASIVGDGQWHTYTLTVSAGTTRVYLDGVQKATRLQGGDTFNPVGDLYLGARQDLSSSNFYGGDLDSVRVFNRSLSAAEVGYVDTGVWPSSPRTLASGSISVTVQNTPPTAVAGGPYSVIAGQSVTLSAVGSTDPNGDVLTYEWDLNYDGSTFNADLSGITNNVTWSQLTAAGIVPGTNTVAVRAIDPSGLDSIASAVLTVTPNTPPTGTPDSYTLNEDTTLTTSPTAGWYDNNWSTRQKISFNNAAGVTLTNQAILVSLNGGLIDYSMTQNNGQDLRFVDQDGTVLDYEIETWNGPGESAVWVRVPQIDGASSTDFIWMYYGNAGATPAQNPAGVWQNGARAIVHMGAPPSDSSASANPVTNSGSVSSSGQIGNARTFDGLNDFVNVGSAAAIDNLFTGGGTISAWVYPTGWGENNYGRIASKASSTFEGITLGNGWNFQVDGSSGRIQFEYGFSSQVGSWHTPSNSISLNTWQLVTVSYDSSSTANNASIYINGVLQTVTRARNPTGTPTSDAAQNLRIGNQAATTDRTFAGSIDEFRAYKAVLSAAQIQADYRAAVGTLTTLGTAESGPSGVLNNDTDVDADSLTVSLGTGPAHAQFFALNADGSFTYQPVADFAGTDSFTYVVSDPINSTGPITVTLNVRNLNDAPTSLSISGTSITGYTDAATVGNVVVIDPDSADTHSFAISDSRFEVVGGVLRLKTGLQVDPIAETTISLTITATDSGGLTVVQAFVLNVINPNNPPGLNLTPLVTTLPENTATTPRIRVADIVIVDDVYGSNTLSLFGVDAAKFEISGGGLYLKAGTVLDFETQSSLSVTVSVDDPTIGASPDATTSFLLTITDVNEAPVPSAGGAYSISEGQSLVLSASASTDPDGNPLTFAWDLNADGDYSDAAGVAPTLTWAQLRALAPAVNDDGSYVVRVRVTDSGGLSATASTILTVTNTAPTVLISGNAATSSGAHYTLNLSATDPGNDSITTWNINWGDGNTDNVVGSLSAATHIYATPGGTRTITMTATDEDGTHAMASPPLIVTVSNTPPSSIGLSDNRVPGHTAGASVGTVTFTDPDFGDVHTLTVSDARFEISGRNLKLRPGVSLDPVAEPTVAVTVTVRDLAGTQATAIFELEVHNRPVAAADSWQIDGTAVFSITSRASGVLANDTDADGDPLTAVLVSGPVNGSAFAFNSDGTFTYRARTGFSGIDTLTYQAFDGDVLSSPVTVTLVVNQPATLQLSPVAPAIAENTAPGTQRLIGTVIVTDDVYGTNVLTLGGADAGKFLLDGANQLFLRSTVVLDYETQSQFNLTINSDDPAIGSGIDFSLAVVVQVIDVNEAPVAGPLANRTVAEDSPGSSFSVSAAFSDPDAGDHLAYSVSVPAGNAGLFSSLSINSSTGLLSWGLNPNANGSATVRIRAVDSGGLAVTQQFEFVVTPVNDAPVAENASLFVITGATLNFSTATLLAATTDPDGDPLTITILTQPANGTLTIQTDGSFKYKSNDNFTGTDSFRFRVSDGILQSNTADAVINVQAIAIIPSTSGSGSGSGAATTTTTSSTSGDGTAARESARPGTASGSSPGLGTGSAAVPASNAGQPSDGTGESSDDLDEAGAALLAIVGRDSSGTFDAGSLMGLKTSTSIARLDAGGSLRELSSAEASRRQIDVTSSLTTADDFAMTAEAQRLFLHRQLAHKLAMWKELDSFEKDVSQRGGFERQLVGSVGAVTTGLSVGYIIWIVRGGMLLSGLLAQMPAWTMFDPMLVVDDQNRDDDGETIHTIVDEQQKKLDLESSRHAVPGRGITVPGDRTG